MRTRLLRRSLRLWLAAILPLAVILFGGDALAYPWMIRHDYTVCSACHVDPSGAGLMTMYGRAQSEVLLRTRYGEPPPDEDPSKLGGFAFGAIPLPEELLLQGDVRAAGLLVKLPAPAPAAPARSVSAPGAAPGLDAIVALLTREGPTSSTDVAVHLGCSEMTALRRLRELVEQGAVERSGKGKNTRYRVGSRSHES